MVARYTQLRFEDEYLAAVARGDQLSDVDDGAQLLRTRCGKLQTRRKKGARIIGLCTTSASLESAGGSGKERYKEPNMYSTIPAQHEDTE